MKMEIELLPILVPDFIIQKSLPRPRQLGFTEAPMFPLSQVDANTLSLLCDQFRKDLFYKAGKDDPRLIPCPPCGED